MMDPAIYRNPSVWDPSRFLPDRAEDKSAPHAFPGWGSGKHPCRGQRVGGYTAYSIATLLTVASLL